MNDVLIKIRDLNTRIGEGPRAVRAVDGLNLEIRRGETFALVGESGCGKSMTALSVMRLLPEPAGRIASGEIWLDGLELLGLPEVKMRRVRGGRIAMTFQERMASLNPFNNTKACGVAPREIALWNCWMRWVFPIQDAGTLTIRTNCLVE